MQPVVITYQLAIISGNMRPTRSNWAERVCVSGVAVNRLRFHRTEPHLAMGIPILERFGDLQDCGDSNRFERESKLGIFGSFDIPSRKRVRTIRYYVSFKIGKNEDEGGICTKC